MKHIVRMSVGLVAGAMSLVSVAHAAPIHVSVYNGGAFGSVTTPNTTSDTQPFVLGGVVNAGDVITLSSTGTMCLSFGNGCAGPDGAVINAPPHVSVLGNIFGALVYAIVPTATVSTSGFQAYDSNDVAVGISASLVQFAGSSITFTATQSGSIFFGVSDSAFWDNTGPGFDVTMTVAPQANVPAPGALALLGLGLLSFAGLRRRKAA